MRHAPVTDEHASRVEQRALVTLRLAVCRHCDWRPPGSERLGSDVPRPCEARCRLFTELPHLLDAARCVDPMVASFGTAMQARVRESCGRPARSGDVGDPGGACPLSRYRRRVIAAIATLVNN